MATFAQRLKELRTERGLSMLELSKKINFTFRAIGKWERGEAKPTLDAIAALANFFGVSADYLIGLVDY
jgi:transcriptional regulator with XRE-family HTH domain